MSPKTKKEKAQNMRFFSYERPFTRFYFGIFVVVSLFVPSAFAQDLLSLKYHATLLALPIGGATMEISFPSPNRYHLQIEAKVGGLASLISSTKGKSEASGILEKDHMFPTTYANIMESSTETRTTRIAFNMGDVQAIEITPPYEDKNERTLLEDSHQKQVIDPASAFLNPVPLSEPLVGPSICQKAIPIFDGVVRFNLTLTFDTLKMVKLPGYEGPVTVCKVRYVPLGGHRPHKLATKFMVENKNIEVWFLPFEKEHMVLPAHISIGTMVGTLVFELKELKRLATN